METIDFSPLSEHAYTAAYVSSLIVIDALEKIDSKTFFMSILGGSVPHPAPLKNK